MRQGTFLSNIQTYLGARSRGHMKIGKITEWFENIIGCLLFIIIIPLSIVADVINWGWHKDGFLIHLDNSKPTFKFSFLDLFKEPVIPYEKILWTPNRTTDRTMFYLDGKGNIIKKDKTGGLR